MYETKPIGLIWDISVRCGSLLCSFRGPSGIDNEKDHGHDRFAPGPDGKNVQPPARRKRLPTGALLSDIDYSMFLARMGVKNEGSTKITYGARAVRHFEYK